MAGYSGPSDPLLADAQSDQLWPETCLYWKSLTHWENGGNDKLHLLGNNTWETHFNHH